MDNQHKQSIKLVTKRLIVFFFVALLLIISFFGALASELEEEFSIDNKTSTKNDSEYIEPIEPVEPVNDTYLSRDLAEYEKTTLVYSTKGDYLTTANVIITIETQEKLLVSDTDYIYVNPSKYSVFVDSKEAPKLVLPATICWFDTNFFFFDSEDKPRLYKDGVLYPDKSVVVYDPLFRKACFTVEGFSEYDLRSDLMAYWAFDNDLIDSTGSFNLTGVGAYTHNQAVINEGINLTITTGRYAYIASTVYTFTETNSFSISFWMNRASNTAYRMILTQRVLGGSDSPPVTVYVNSNIVYFRVINATAGQEIADSGTHPFNTWVHYVGTYNASSRVFSVYRNGVLINNVSVTLTNWLVNSASANFNIGRNSNPASSQDYDGSLDEVAVYGVALSSSDVEILYNDGYGLSYDDMVSETFPNTTIIYEDDFSGASTEWTGGTHNTSQNVYEANTSNTFFTSPDLNISLYSYYGFCWSAYYVNGTNDTKIYFNEEEGTTTNKHLIGDYSGGNLRWREEPGYEAITNTAYNKFNNYCARVNVTGDYLRFYINDVFRFQFNLSGINNSDERDYIRMDTGSFNGIVKISNTSFFVLDNETSLTEIGGSGSFNISVMCNSSISSGLINGTEQGWNDESRCDNFERLLASHEISGNITKTETIDGKDYLLTPWFSASNVCAEANLKTDCGAAGTFDDYCLVSDEFSQYALSLSMSQNSSRSLIVNNTFNTIKALNASSGGYGSLIEWLVRVTDSGGSKTINKGYTDDTASDADARIIIALRNFYSNNAYSGADNTAIGDYLTTMCSDFLEHDFVSNAGKTSVVNTSRTINFYPAGGANVAASGISANDFFYSGYYGDVTLALLACSAHTNNGTFVVAAQDVVETYFAAANWTPDKGYLSFPPGRAFKWSSSETPVAECTTLCSPPYIDDPDGKRFTTLCAAEYLSRAKQGVSLHPWLINYCSDLGNFSEVSSNEWVVQWYSDNSSDQSYSSASDGFSPNALAMHVDMSFNTSNLVTRFDHIGSKYSLLTNSFDSAVCSGLYEPSFVLQAYGYSLGYADLSFSNTSSLSIPSISVSGVSFYQGNLTSADDPICNATSVYDGDFANITFYYSWYINGTSIFSGSLSNQTPNTEINVSVLDGSLISRNDNLTCEVWASDSLITSNKVNVSGTINNAAPVILSSYITKSGYDLFCNYTFSDADNDTETAFYDWYKNDLFLSTSSSIDITTESIGTTFVCSITLYDGTTNSTPLNSTLFTVGDENAPTLGVLTFGTVSDVNVPNNFNVFCSDEDGLAIGFPRLSITNPNGINDDNLNMSLIGSDTYQRTYTPYVVGTHTVLVECLDVNANLASDVYYWSVVASGGASGGGGASSVVGQSCGFEVVQPVAGNELSFFACAPGSERVGVIRVESFANFDKNLFIDYSEMPFCSGPDNVFLGAKTKASLEVVCVCPANKQTLTGTIYVSDNTCSLQDEVRVRVTGNIFGVFFDSPLKAGASLIALLVGFSLVVAGIGRLSS